MKSTHLTHAEYYTYINPAGGVYFCFQQENDAIILKLDYPFSPKSKLLPISDKKFFWFDKYENGSSTIDLYTISIE